MPARMSQQLSPSKLSTCADTHTPRGRFFPELTGAKSVLGTARAASKQTSPEPASATFSFYNPMPQCCTTTKIEVTTYNKQCLLNRGTAHGNAP